MTGPELQLPTTVGTYALENSIAKRNAPIVDRVSLSLHSSVWMLTNLPEIVFSTDSDHSSFKPALSFLERQTFQ